MIFIQSLFRYTKSCFSQSQCTHSCVCSLLEKVNPHRKQVELDNWEGRCGDVEHRGDGTEKVRGVTLRGESNQLIANSQCQCFSVPRCIELGMGEETRADVRLRKLEGRRELGGVLVHVELGCLVDINGQTEKMIVASRDPR